MKSVKIKFGLSEKHKKFEKIFLMVLTNQLIYLVNVKTMRKIFSNYVCFSKSPNFKFQPDIPQLFLLWSNIHSAAKTELSVESSQLPPQGLMMIIPKKLFTLSGDLLRICDSLSCKRWHFPTFERTILVVEFVKEWVAYFFSNLANSSHISWASIAYLWLTIL